MGARCNTAGFSLVEVMMVVAIIGLMTGAVVLALPSRTDNLTTELARTERALIALSRTSVMTGRILGVRFASDGFETLVFSDDGWMQNDGLLKHDARHWPELDLLSLTVDGVEADIDSGVAGPHLWFLPTGEYPSFNIVLSGGNARAHLSANASGPMKISGDE